MKVSMIQNAFSGGEISKKMRGRTDIEGLLKNSGREITNFIVTTQGALMRRPGTKHLGRAMKTQSRLIPINITANDSYLVEIASGVGRLIKDRAILMTNKGLTNATFTGSITGWTSSSTGTASISHDGANNRLNLVGASSSISRAYQQVTGLINAYNRYTLTATVYPSGATVTIGVGTANNTADLASYTTTTTSSGQTISFTFDVNPGATSFYIILQNSTTSTVQIDDVNLDVGYTFTVSGITSSPEQLRWAQAGDTLYLTSTDGTQKPLYLTIDTATDAVTSGTVSFSGGPYNDINDTLYGGRGSNKTMTPGATTGATTLTASSATFVSTDVGRLVRFRTVNTAAWGEATITGYTSTTVVNITISKTLDGVTASKEWQLGSWSDTTGYPRVVDTTQARLIFANSTYEPNGFWASASSALTTFRPDDNYDDVITASTAFATQLTDLVDVLWLASSGTRMLAGSSVGVVAITNISAGISGIAAQLLDTTQCNDSRAIKAQGAALYITRTGRTLAETAYVFEDVDEGFRTKDTLLWSDHLTTGRVKKVAYQALPHQIIWMIDNSGNLFGCTYSRAERLRAWHAHVLGKASDEDNIAINDIAVVTTTGGTLTDNNEDLYLVTYRSNTGPTIEYLSLIPTEDYTYDQMYYVDNGLSYSPSASTLSGFLFVAGETLRVFANGAAIADKTVSADGTLALGATYSNIHAGYGYESTFTSNRIEGGNPAGAGMGKKVKINEVNIQFFLTSAAEIGYNNGVLDSIPFEDLPNLFDGFKRMRVSSGSSQEACVTIASTHAYPINISSISYDIDVEAT